MSLFNVGFVIFPDLTQLDFTGPQQVLARLPDSAMHIVAKSKDPVPSDSGFSLMPTYTFENCPDLDLIASQEGTKALSMRSATRKPSTSFDGRRARLDTSHPYVLARSSSGLLAYSGRAQRRTGAMRNAPARKARIVKDGNVITAGGVTSGIDSTPVAEIAGETVAQDIQLGIQYDPSPPFDCGHPDRASESVKAAVTPRCEQRRAAFREN